MLEIGDEYVIDALTRVSSWVKTYARYAGVLLSQRPWQKMKNVQMVDGNV